MPDERSFTHLSGGQTHFRGPRDDDHATGALAAAQHGVVARSQLFDLGISRRVVDNRLARGWLHRLFAGVYAVGNPRPTPLALTCAGVLALAPRPERASGDQNTAGREVAASHFSAAAAAGLAETYPSRVHLTTVHRKRPQPGLVGHRGVLPADEISVVRGIPVTCAARTLLDLSAVLDARALRRLIKRAEFVSAVSFRELEEILERYPRRKGRRTLAALVADGTADPGRSRSDLEDEFHAFCRRHQLPQPETNRLLYLRGSRFEVDCVWKRAKLVVELDGWQAHGGRLAFEDDRTRDSALTAAGWTVVRITWRQLRDEATLVSELRTLLSNPPTNGSSAT